ncbi:MAG: PKD domain-containing protein [Actinomycetota bacterium]
MSRRWTRRGALLTAFAVLATALVVASLARPEPAEAARQAPSGPLPNCVVDDFGTPGLGCAPNGESFGAAVGGKFGQNGSFTITSSPGGLAPCLTYKSTGCYYGLNNPSLVRCVYLANNDPNEVRSCGSIGSQGGPSASRQGRCDGSLGSTYVYGGDARFANTWWTARAARLANCTFEVSDRPIDNLRGPTFWLVRTSVRECVIAGGFGCDEAPSVLQTVTEYAWLPVDGTLAPHAAFVPDEIEPGLVDFDNISEPYATGSTTWEWDFGDGGSSTAHSPVHRYATPGEYTVRLTMRSSEGPSTSETQTVEIKAPQLEVSVFDPDARFGPGESGNRYSIGDEFTAKIIVTATDGLGDLSDVAPDPALLTLPAQLESVEELPVVDPRTFGPDDRAEYDVLVRAVDAGRFDLDSRWRGTDIGGTEVAETGTLAGSVTGLKVEVIPDPDPLVVDQDNNDDDEITDEDNDITIKVKVTNLTGAPITNITYDELDLSSNLLRDPEVDLELQTEPDRPFNDLPIDGTDELEWIYRATDAVDARAQILVTGTAASGPVTTNGEGDVVAITERLLEAAITLDGQALTSGKPVRFTGVFKNVTDEGETPRNVAFAVERQFSSLPRALSRDVDAPNGGNGWFNRTGGPTAGGLEVFELEPGASITLTALVHTMETPVDTGFVVEFEVQPYAEKLDTNGDPVVPQEYEVADPRNVEFSDESGSAERHTVTVAGVTEEKEQQQYLSCGSELGFSTYISCKFTAGIITMGRGLGELVVLGYHVASGVASGFIWALRNYFQFLIEDAEGKQALKDEITAELLEMKRLGYEALQNIDVTQIPVLVGGAIDSAITRIADVLATNDIKLIYGELAEIAGENVDLVLEALVAAKVLVKTSLAVGGRAGLVRRSVLNAIEKEGQDSIDAALKVIREQGERALPGSRVMRAGVDVTDYPQIAKAYGASVDDVKNLFRIAEDKGVTIVFRSRSPKSIDLIESGRALPKPQGVKTKGVNDLDMNYLGYPNEYDSVIAIVEPPVKSVGEINGFVDNIEKIKNMPDGPAKTDLRNALRERLKTRLKEWDEFEADRAQWERSPSDRIDGKQGGIKVDFDPEFNQLERKYIEEVDNVRGRVLEEPDLSDGRKVYRVQMEGGPDVPPGPDGTRFRDITGDIDFLAILTPDGRVLGQGVQGAQLTKELDQRADVYKMMQELLGMQHGESFTIPPGKIRNKYMRDGLDADGGETLLAATPQRRLMTTYFDDGLSTLLGGPNGDLVRLYERTFFEGIYQEAFSPTRILDLLTVAELRKAYDKFTSIGRYFGLSIFARVTGFADNLLAEVTRDGQAVRPSADGGAEEYVPPAPSSRTVEPGALGGVWRPVAEADVVTNGRIGLRPWTYIDGRALPGDTTVPAESKVDMGVPATNAWFEVGDVVAVDPGGGDEEFVTLASVSPMRFTTPLVNDHEWGTTVLLADADRSGGAGGGGGGAGDTPVVVPLVPARLAETRRGPGLETIDGAVEGIGRRTPQSVTEIPVVGRGGVPATGVAAAVLNVTAVGSTGPGNVRVFPCGDTPNASSVNHRDENVANEVIAKLDAAGQVCVFTSRDIDLVVDVVGYVPAASDYTALVPARVVETRGGDGLATIDGEVEGIGRRSPQQVTRVPIAGRGGVPATGVGAAVLNVTAVGPAGPGNVRVFPCGETPNASSVNHRNENVANEVIAKVDDDGHVCLFTSTDIDLVVDVVGYIPASSDYVPLVPARLVETRSGPGLNTIDGEFEGIGRRTPQSVARVDVAGRGGVPGDGVAAAVLNVTAVGSTGPGNVRVFPCGDTPNASSVNHRDENVANEVIAKLDPAGQVCFFTSRDIDLVVDVVGYVPAA